MFEDNATKRTIRIRKAIAVAEQLTHEMCDLFDQRELHIKASILREQASIIHMLTGPGWEKDS